MEVGVHLKKYKRPSRETYMRYHKNANRLLIDVAENFEISISQVRFEHIVNFFESNYNIFLFILNPTYYILGFLIKNQNLNIILLLRTP